LPTRQQIELIAHEAAERILRRAGDRFATDIKTGVDQNWASRQSLESFVQPMKQRVIIVLAWTVCIRAE
jgi:hypothetical protein